MTNNYIFKGIDLFCGIGGSSLGAQDAGVQILAGFDMWQLAGNVYKVNFPKAKFYPYRLQDINPLSVKNELGEIDLILASPECTSHSVARGNREKDKESLNLAYEVLRFADVLNPRWIVIENVTSMKRWDKYPDFLKRLGDKYKYLEQSLIASDFGVPQSRRRLFIICDREQKPTPITPPQNITARFASQVLSMNGVYNFSPLETKKRARATIERAYRAFKVLGKKEPFLLVYYGSDAAGGWQPLNVPLRTITTIDRFALVKPKGTGKGHLMRMLQPPELQAAMGFPEEFNLTEALGEIRFTCLGMLSVPL